MAAMLPSCLVTVQNVVAVTNVLSKVGHASGVLTLSPECPEKEPVQGKEGVLLEDHAARPGHPLQPLRKTSQDTGPGREHRDER